MEACVHRAQRLGRDDRVPRAFLGPRHRAGEGRRSGRPVQVPPKAWTVADSGAVFTGNAGVFCWWSYVSPWLQKTGGYDSDMVPFLMMLAGFGMVVGGIIGGRITDNWRHAGTAASGRRSPASVCCWCSWCPATM